MAVAAIMPSCSCMDVVTSHHPDPTCHIMTGQQEAAGGSMRSMLPAAHYTPPAANTVWILLVPGCSTQWQRMPWMPYWQQWLQRQGRALPQPSAGTDIITAARPIPGHQTNRVVTAAALHAACTT